MITVSAKEFRHKLSYYLDQVERGEEISIIRNSRIIGYLRPADTQELPVAETIQSPSTHSTGQSSSVAHALGVTFRRFGVFEDPSQLKQLHKDALEAVGAYVEDAKLDLDLDSPGMAYDKMEGEFWVGELQGQVVAMGGFRMAFNGHTQEAELKRMRVKPSLQGQGLGGELLELLESRARKAGYRTMVLDITSAPKQQPARQFYATHGYEETGREPTDNFDILYYRKEL